MPLSPNLANDVMARAARIHHLAPATQAGVSAALLLPPLAFFLVRGMPRIVGISMSTTGSLLWQLAVVGGLGAYLVVSVAVFTREPQRRVLAIGVAGAATALQMVAIVWSAWGYQVTGSSAAMRFLAYRAEIVLSVVLVVAAWGIARRTNRIWPIGLLVPLLLAPFLVGVHAATGIEGWLRWAVTVGLGCAACWGIDVLASQNTPSAAMGPVSQSTLSAYIAPAASTVLPIPDPAAQYLPMGGYPVAQKTNSMAIAALVAGLVVAPLGVIFGHISLSQIKRTNEDGRGLAIAGLVIGYVGSAIAIAYIVGSLIFLSWLKSSVDSIADSTYTTTTTSTLQPTPVGTPGSTALAIFNSEVGDCIRRVTGASNGDGTSSVTVSTASCSSSSATDRVTKRTTSIGNCGSQWVRTTDYSPPIVLCLVKQ